MMRIHLVTLGVLMISLLTSCGSEPNKGDYTSPYLDRPAGSKIGICGAGLEEGLAAKLEAQFLRTGGQVTADFQRFVRTAIFSTDDLASSDKQKMYDAYISCVLEIDKRERDHSNTCIGRCEILKSSCYNSKNSQYQSCHIQGHNNCVKECMTKFGISGNVCVKDLCDMSNLVNIAQWDKLYCRSQREALLRCDDDFETCLRVC